MPFTKVPSDGCYCTHCEDLRAMEAAAALAAAAAALYEEVWE